MRILIDADGCPVVNIAVALAKAHHLSCFILCDTAHEIQQAGAVTITVSKGADSVDFALVNRLQKGDLVVTQDYGLAAMCLAKGAVPVHQDGMVYDASNIDSLLAQRHMAKKLRSAGGRLHSAPKRRPAQDAAFSRTLTALIRKDGTLHETDS